MSFDLKIINKDLVIKSGSLQNVINSEKLVQDILKICLTTAGSNPLHPGYGSLISRTLIGNPIHSSVLEQIGKAQINTCLENIKILQESQIKNFQRVSADEQLASILDISIYRNNIDPRFFQISIKVLSKGLKQVSTTFNVSTI